MVTNLSLYELHKYLYIARKRPNPVVSLKYGTGQWAVYFRKYEFYDNFMTKVFY
jgi:hypothetical protein